MDGWTCSSPPRAPCRSPMATWPGRDQVDSEDRLRKERAIASAVLITYLERVILKSTGSPDDFSLKRESICSPDYFSCLKNRREAVLIASKNIHF